MPHRRPIFWLLSMLFLAAVPARAAEPWIKVTTARYTVYSQQDEARTVRWVRDYDRFIDGVADVLGVDAGRLSPLTVVIFANEAELRPYLPRDRDGRVLSFTRAVFVQEGGRSVAALAADPDDAAARRLLFHESAHWLLSHSDGRVPAWLDEGVAQLFATAELDAGGLRWGAPEAAMLRFAQAPRAPLLPAAAVIEAGRDDPLFESGPQAGAFYAQAWALAHALLLGDGRACLEALGEASPAVLAARLGLGSAAELDGFVRDYLRRPQFESAHTGAARGGAAALVIARIEPATSSEVDAARGSLAMVAGARTPLPRIAAAVP